MSGVERLLLGGPEFPAVLACDFSVSNKASHGLPLLFSGVGVVMSSQLVVLGRICIVSPNGLQDTLEDVLSLFELSSGVIPLIVLGNVVEVLVVVICQLVVGEHEPGLDGADTS